MPNDTHRERRAQLEAEREALQTTDVKGLEKKVSDLREELSETRSGMQPLEERLAELKQEALDLEKKLREAKDEISFTKSRIAQVKQERERRRARPLKA